CHGPGRKALSGGGGMLDLVTLHHEVLAGIARLTSVELDRAAEFLTESLSPFEMSFRGCRETNAELSIANENLRAAKAATEAANRELEYFSYSVAHDLRAPLRSIDGFSQAVLEDSGDVLHDECKVHLRYVREAAQDMAALIDGLLGLSRVTRSELHHETLDLSDVARSTLVQLRKTAPDRAV